MAENAARMKPYLVPPAVLGHEEEQEWLDRSDLPAAGWVDPASVRAVPDTDFPGEMILKGNVVNIPEKVKALLDSGEYGYGSSEIYDDFPDDFGNHHGETLRRFALLGSEVPQVKRLGRLPAAVPMPAPVAFAEKLPARGERCVWVAFSERRVSRFADGTAGPTRADLIKAILDAMPGMSQSTVEQSSDDALKEWVANLPTPAPTPTPGAAGMDRAGMIAEMVAAGQPQAELEMLDDAALKAKYDAWKGAAAAPPAAGPVTTMGDPATMPREELVAALTGAGQDPVALEAMTDDELKKMYTDLGLGADAPPADVAAVAAMGDNCKPHTFAERKAVAHLARVTKYAEQAAAQLRRQMAATKKTKVSQFCEQMVREGRILPAQKGDYLSLLSFLNDEAPVAKFSENGRTLMVTALDRKMKELAARSPVVRLGEGVPAGHAFGLPAAGSAQAEVKKVERFCEARGDWLRRQNQNPKEFVELAKKMADRDPNFTAEQLLGRGYADVM